MPEKEQPSEEQPEETPAGQAWFDNIWLWFILSIVISGLMYNVWGLLELFR
jgi:hypothetical protein